MSREDMPPRDMSWCQASGPVRTGRDSARVWTRPRQNGPVTAGPGEELRRAFLRQADNCRANGSPLYAEACTRLAGTPAVAGIVREARWDTPLRLLGGIHYLALRDEVDPWPDWPQRERSLVAHMGFHGQWLEWLER